MMNENEFLSLIDVYTDMLNKDIKNNIENPKNREILVMRFFKDSIDQFPESDDEREQKAIEGISRFHAMLAVLDLTSRLVDKTGEKLIAEVDREETKNVAEFATMILKRCKHEDE